MNQLNNTILYLAKDKSKEFIHILKNLCPKIGIPLDPNLKNWTENKGILIVHSTLISWWSAHIEYLTDEQNIENIPNGHEIDWVKKIIPIYTHKDLFRVIGQLTELIPDNPFLVEGVKDKNIKFIKENILAPDNKNKCYISYPIKNKIYRDASGKFAPKLPKIAKFVYQNNLLATNRKIKVVEVDKEYIKGYDLNDGNKYKIFKRNRIYLNQVKWEKI